MIHEQVKVAHEDERRKLTAIFNGDFHAEQVKVLEVKGKNTLGNHYHDYRELFYILKGAAVFYLENVETGEKEIYIMSQGDRLIIEPKTAHMVIMNEGTITIEATESKYIDADTNDHPYKVKNWFIV